MKQIVSIFILGCALINVSLCEYDLNKAGVRIGTLPLVGSVPLVAIRAGLRRSAGGEQFADALRENPTKFLAAYGAGSSLYIPLYAGGAVVAYKKKRKKLAATIATVGVADMTARAVAALFLYKKIRP